MKYAEIPKFIQSRYRINLPWDSLEHEITEKYSDIPGGFQLCPEFQRGHVWTEEQQIAYVEYCLRGGISSREIYVNFKGHMSGFEGPILLVDGLQRITAVRRFMKNEIPVFGVYHDDFEDEMGFSEAFFFWNVNNLRKMSDVLKWYLELNSGGTPHTKEEIERVKAMLIEAQQKSL